MHAYRTHTCGALRATDASSQARLSGWVHAKRDHGGLLFIDLRDHYGITQCVFAAGSPAFAAIDSVRPESVITVTGQVVMREAGTINPKLPTGEIELRVAEMVVQSEVPSVPVTGPTSFQAIVPPFALLPVMVSEFQRDWPKPSFSKSFCWAKVG